MISIVDLAWASGFMEGEGSFQVKRGKKSPYVWIGAAQVQREPLERLQRIFGGRLYARPRHESNRQDFHQWQITGGRAAGIMMTIYVFMSPRRREQIRAALDAWRTVKPRIRREYACVNGHEWTPASTYTNPAGKTFCRICNRDANRRWDRKRREQRRAQLRLIG